MMGLLTRTASAFGLLLIASAAEAQPFAPVVVSLEKDAPLTFSRPQVRFDLDGDGKAELVGWPVDAISIAFLAHDRNENGRIDNGTELLTASLAEGAVNGIDAFGKLAQAAGPSAEEGIVDDTHPLFLKLTLWNDLNRNGVSEPGELRPASDVLVAIGLGYVMLQRDVLMELERNGNAFRWEGYAQFKEDKWGTVNEREAPNGVTIVDVTGKPIIVYEPRPFRPIYDVALAVGR